MDIIRAAAVQNESWHPFIISSFDKIHFFLWKKKKLMYFLGSAYEPLYFLPPITSYFALQVL